MYCILFVFSVCNWNVSAAFGR